VRQNLNNDNQAFQRTICATVPLPEAEGPVNRNDGNRFCGHFYLIIVAKRSK
jgi:hypothetical protein